MFYVFKCGLCDKCDSRAMLVLDGVVRCVQFYFVRDGCFFIC